MPKPTAGQVAAELRILADSLDTNPNAIVQKAWLSFHCDTKEEYVNIVRLLPRPLKKSEDSTDDKWRRIKVEHDGTAVDIWASVLKNLTCTLVKPAQPAVYECDPILSIEEDEAISG